MKDAQGQNRGPCNEDSCGCNEYLKPNDSNKCDYCGHYPTQHKLLNNTTNTNNNNNNSVPQKSTNTTSSKILPSSNNNNKPLGSSSTSNTSSNTSSPNKLPTNTNKTVDSDDEEDRVIMAPREPGVVGN